MGILGPSRRHARFLAFRRLPLLAIRDQQFPPSHVVRRPLRLFDGQRDRDGIQRNRCLHLDIGYRNIQYEW